MCPLAQIDGHDAPRLIDEAVPGEAAVVDDVIVGFEDAVRQPVVTHELPYILDRAQLGAAWRQRHKGDVVGHDQFSRTMPSRLIKQQDSVCARRDVEGDFFQMHRHASLLQRGMTMPAPFPSAGQIAPKIHAEDRR